MLYVLVITTRFLLFNNDNEMVKLVYFSLKDTQLRITQL